eukprot:SAG31_NODE_8876_length_1369_cov_1.230709_2_plen_89_part_00
MGGLAYGSVTEDIHTGMRIHNQGWREFYYGEVMVPGEAPDTLTALMAQRLRWAVGPLQMLKIDNPVSSPRVEHGDHTHLVTLPLLLTI